MPPLIKVGDEPNLVPTSKYPYATFPFANFNPVQSRIFEFYDKDCNAVIAAATSAGKTVVGEMFANHELEVRKGSFLYLCPLRALAQEKVDDWTDPSHPFSKKKVSICTGDYRLTPERAKELSEAEVIIMTSEMLNHRCRNYKSEGSTFLNNLGTIVVDESHLLTVPGRGDHLEVGLMKLTKMNPKCRIVLLSATMPNVDEIAEWVSYNLTKRDTYVLVSQYRPCPLTIHFDNYSDDEKTYDRKEENKVERAIEIVKYYPNDKFLIFAHTKRTGERMSKDLAAAGVQNEFHNADLVKEKRIALEKRFKTDPDFRCVVATSTLAWGVNLPSRRVIVLGVHRGVPEVPTYDIFQMIGRAGRPAYDPAGDAYILVPASQSAMWRARLRNQARIESQLLEKVGDNFKLLAFHLCSEIHHGAVTCEDDVRAWFERTLAHFQSKEFDDTAVTNVVKLLKDCGAVADDDGHLKATTVGVISSIFYFSPFDVNHLRRNFRDLFASGNENDNIHVALALANIDSNQLGFTSRAEREELESFQIRLRNMDLDKIYGIKNGEIREGVVKAAFMYNCLLSGTPTNAMAGVMRGLQHDSPRVLQIVSALDSMSGKWGKKSFIEALEKRVRYGVPAHLIDLVGVPHLGQVRANNLFKAGIKNLEDLVEMKPEELMKITKMSRKLVDEVIEEANVKLATT